MKRKGLTMFLSSLALLTAFLILGEVAHERKMRWVMPWIVTGMCVCVAGAAVALQSMTRS